MAATPADIRRLRGEIAKLEANALAQEVSLSAELEGLHPDNRAAGRNLLHYLALRQHDLRDLQRELTALGLSSLGRSEPYVFATLEAVERALGGLSGESAAAVPSSKAPTRFETADAALRERASAL